MLLINVVMVKFSEKDLVQAKVETAHLLIRALGQKLGNLQLYEKERFQTISSDPQFKSDVTQLLSEAGFSETMIVNLRNKPIFSTNAPEGKSTRGFIPAREAMKTGMSSTDFSGMTWGVIWFSPEEIRMSSPLRFEGQVIGGVSTRASLTPIYNNLRKSERFVIIYIIADTIILALVGMYLLSRIVVNPIHRLLKLTAEYKEGVIFPSVGEASRDEIGQLSRSMNFMLKRLDENKRELKAHIYSLEQANSELQRAQNEIIRSEKLASVGRLAAGIAHEIGNPIGIVLGYLEMINKNVLTEDEKTDFLCRIETEVTRINQIIRNLLDFSRPSNGKPRETHAHEIIQNTVDILHPQPMMGDIRIEKRLTASKDLILADPNQLQQIFLNLIMNAADTLVERKNGANEDRESVLIIESRDSGETIELRFEDNGSGIPENELFQIFDPFYTTKEPGEGTGLGLSVCYRIVEGIGGSIRAESDVGKGTTIIVNLPISENGGH